ncbi:hypothetical protein [Paraburkholderia sp.]|nr:hypothetical protein [Paraburkholderia sp.]
MAFHPADTDVKRLLAFLSRLVHVQAHVRTHKSKTGRAARYV